LVSASRRGPQGRGSAALTTSTASSFKGPFSSTPEGLDEHACVRTEPRAGANPTDRADSQGQGGPDLACQISAAKTGRPWPIGFCGWPPWGWLAALSRPDHFGGSASVERAAADGFVKSPRAIW